MVLQGLRGRVVALGVRGKDRGGATAESHRVRTPFPLYKITAKTLLNYSIQNKCVCKTTTYNNTRRMEEAPQTVANHMPRYLSITSAAITAARDSAAITTTERNREVESAH